MNSEKQDWEEREKFVQACLRYRGLLYQIAVSILGGPEGAEEAVHRSLAAAMRTPGKDRKCAGEFRSWLLRIMIDEALRIRRLRNPQDPLRAVWCAGSTEPHVLAEKA